MKAIFVGGLVILGAVLRVPVHGATLRLNADVVSTFNSVDGGRPSVPLVKDDAGNVLNPTIGQGYAVQVTMSISDFDELPNAKLEEGFAGGVFDIALDGLEENSVWPGWRLAQQNIDLRPGPGGCCVPLWLDLCDCGDGGPLTDISVGIDVADFPRAAQIGNPAQDPRRTIGQGYTEGSGILLGTVFVDYLGGEARLSLDIESFQVHDLEAIFPAEGPAFGDSVLFVPEPGTSMIALIAGSTWGVLSLARLCPFA